MALHVFFSGAEYFHSSLCCYVLSVWGFGCSQVCGHKSERRIYGLFVCLWCLSSIFFPLSCLRQKAAPAYISQCDILSLTYAHTHHQDLQQRAIGCTLPPSQWYYSTHAHHYSCQRLSTCVYILWMCVQLCFIGWPQRSTVFVFITTPFTPHTKAKSDSHSSSCFMHKVLKKWHKTDDNESTEKDGGAGRAVMSVKGRESVEKGKQGRQSTERKGSESV